MFILAIIGIVALVLMSVVVIGIMVFNKQVDKYGVFEYEKRLPKMIQKFFNLLY